MCHSCRENQRLRDELERLKEKNRFRCTKCHSDNHRTVEFPGFWHPYYIVKCLDCGNHYEVNDMETY